MQLEEVNELVFTWNGYDLIKMMGLNGIVDEDINYRIKGYSDNIVAWNGDTVNKEEDFTGIVSTSANASDKRKVLFVRDSFATSMLPFFASQFSEVYSPHRGYFSEVMIEEQEPDILVWQFVEREVAAWPDLGRE